MKNVYINDINVESEVLDFFMVKNFAIKLGANKKQYLDLALGDKTGEISGKKWDISDQEILALEGIKEGDVVKVRATVTEWNGLKQLKLAKVRKANEDEKFEIMDFVKAAPISADVMFAFIKAAVVTMKDEDLKAICHRILDDHKEKLMYYPAASKNHHAELSGLLYHIKRMLELAERVCDVYANLNRDLVVTGVIIHDIEKLNEMDANELGIVSGYSFEGQMLGHLIQGVKIIDRLAAELAISNEKAIMLEHMMISHHYEAEFGSPKKPLFPEAEILHYLDMIDAKMYDMEEALDNIEPGSFSERVYTMDNRRLYKSKEFARIIKKK
ncbi:MAG: HD domain-containing protein [Eubacteriales bacterium]